MDSLKQSWGPPRVQGLHFEELLTFTFLKSTSYEVALTT